MVKKDNSERINFSIVLKSLVGLFFIAVWGLLAFWDADVLYRVSEQSLFLFNKHFFVESMTLPAGFLSWLGAFFIQFFHYPILGATIYTALLYALYLLVKKVFDIPSRWSLLALLPVVAVLAYSTQLGYWIFYIKLQGFYYIALLGTLISLLAMWLCYKLRAGYRMLFVFLWILIGYPFLGAYALGAAAVMSIATLVDTLKSRNRVLFGILSIFTGLAFIMGIPFKYYNDGVYSTMALSHMHLAGTPVHQWITESETLYPHGIFEYWLPFILLLFFCVSLAVLKGSLSATSQGKSDKIYKISQLLLFAIIVALATFYWYRDNNFRIENKQNRAMWSEDWASVAEYAKDATIPTRQIVLNKNMALLKMGRLGEDAFKYPDGSADIAHPSVVHLTQTGGMMNYFQYGKFNFCYRWCIENSVEYGWRLEYLKHATRSLLLSGQHKLAMRYINILKHTLFYRSWAEEMERLIEEPSLISKQEEFKMPLLMYSYSDALELDDSYVEVYLSNSLSYNRYPNDSRMYIEAAVVFALIRKDVKLFWETLSRYINKGKITRVPHHFQEAIILFTNISKDITTNIPIDNNVKKRFEAFLKETKKYKGMKEKEMAPYFVEEYGDTYWYFYFFVREIKTN